MPPPPAPLPIEALPAWASICGVSFNNVRLDRIPGKGVGLAASRRLSLAAGHEGANDDEALLKVPRDLVLSIDAVAQYAQLDTNFAGLLAAAGQPTARSHIALFLLAHLASSRAKDKAKKLVPTSWTNYIEFLPRDILVPTLWTEQERSLLDGTSLQSAVHAKMASLGNEFAELRAAAADMPFWDALLGGSSPVVNVDDWALVDAWYRSRCLELPTAGESMVPCVDMANHSSEPHAYYDEDSGGDVEILLRPGFGVAEGDEVTISYGEFKSPAEMLFSYGFIDRAHSADEATLVFDHFDDDPLARAKAHVFGSLPTVRLSRVPADGKQQQQSDPSQNQADTVTWSAPVLDIMCLNEEDGLDFRLLQDNEGGRDLRVFWQEKDVTDKAADFASLTKDHPNAPVFRLRVVAMLAQQLTTQLERLQAPRINELQPPGVEAGGSPELRTDCIGAATLLRGIEGALVEGALAALSEEQATLLADETVKEYLGAAEAAQEEEDDEVDEHENANPAQTGV